MDSRGLIELAAAIKRMEGDSMVAECRKIVIDRLGINKSLNGRDLAALAVAMPNPEVLNGLLPKALLTAQRKPPALHAKDCVQILRVYAEKPDLANHEVVQFVARRLDRTLVLEETWLASLIWAVVRLKTDQADACIIANLKSHLLSLSSARWILSAMKTSGSSHSILFLPLVLESVKKRVMEFSVESSKFYETLAGVLMDAVQVDRAIQQQERSSFQKIPRDSCLPWNEIASIIPPPPEPAVDAFAKICVAFSFSKVSLESPIWAHSIEFLSRSSTPPAALANFWLAICSARHPFALSNPPPRLPNWAMPTVLHAECSIWSLKADSSSFPEIDSLSQKSNIWILTGKGYGELPDVSGRLVPILGRPTISVFYRSKDQTGMKEALQKALISYPSLSPTPLHLEISRRLLCFGFVIEDFGLFFTVNGKPVVVGRKSLGIFRAIAEVACADTGSEDCLMILGAAGEDYEIANVVSDWLEG